MQPITPVEADDDIIFVKIVKATSMPSQKKPRTRSARARKNAGQSRNTLSAPPKLGAFQQLLARLAKEKKKGKTTPPIKKLIQKTPGTDKTSACMAYFRKYLRTPGPAPMSNGTRSKSKPRMQKWLKGLRQ